MARGFHLSFIVPDKDAAKKFYLEILGCSLGRDHGAWFDILFFGHQLTIHQSSPQKPAYQIDHFGPILNKEEWLAVADRCNNGEVGFVMKPTIMHEGENNESGKFLVTDSAGNLLEFKYYQNFVGTMTSGDV